MAQPYATADDVDGITLGGEAPTDEQIGRLLDAAYVKLTAPNAVPALEAWITSGKVNPKLVKLVLVEMVQAVLRNPTGQRSGSRSTGPFSQSWSWDSAAASGLLVVTDEHRAMLGMPVGHSTYTVDAPVTPGWACP